jgi:hypothetical protein
MLLYRTVKWRVIRENIPCFKETTASVAVEYMQIHADNKPKTFICLDSSTDLLSTGQR